MSGRIMKTEMWTTKTLGEKLGCPTKTARELVASGKIQAVKVGRGYRTTPEWVDEYLKKLGA